MYCTTTDLEKLLAPDVLRQLADDGPGGPQPEAVMLEAIEQADREIDSYLGVVVPVPLEPVPPLVANLSAKIAVYNLHRRRSHLELGEWGKEYDRALKLLERIARGEVSMGPTAENGEPAEPLNPGRAAVETRRPEFPDGEWERF